MDVANRLRDVRKNFGLSQSEMAQRLETPYRTYQAYEQGAQVPKLALLEKLAVEGVSIDWLLTGGGEMQRRGLSEEGAHYLHTETLKNCIVAVEEILQEMGWTMTADARAALIALVFEHEQAARTEGRAGLAGAEIIRLVRSADRK